MTDLGTAASNNLNSYSPISTLERQYTAKACLIAVHADGGCCLPDGVEGLWKAQQQQSNTMNSSSSTWGNAVTASPSASVSASYQGATFEPNDSQSPYNSNGATSRTTGNDNNNGDPFSFLDTDAVSASATTSTTNSLDTFPSSTTSPRKGPNLGRFLKKVAKTTTQSLERGMHNLAVRADAGGRRNNPDVMVAALYVPVGASSLSPSYPTDAPYHEALVSMTELQPLPTDESVRVKQGVRFVIPLVLPYHYLNQTNMNNQDSVIIKLWIKSGAALLQQTNVAKYHLIGQVMVRGISSMVQQLRATNNNSSAAVHMTVPLQSTLLAIQNHGKLNLSIVPDPKFPRLCGRGWSLADPDPSSAYQQESTLFHLPLDQSYVFSHHRLQSSSQQHYFYHSILMATERSTESAVALPIAAAMAQLSSEAASYSLQRCQALARTILQHRHDYYNTYGADNDTISAADVTLQIGCLQPNDSASAVATALLQGTTPFCSVSWQRPDSIFEVGLLHSTKLTIAHTVATTGFSPTATVRFYPKAVPRQEALPALQQQQQAPFLLGTIRMEIIIPRPRSGGIGMMDNTSSSNAKDEIWEAFLPMEHLVARQPQQAATVINLPVWNIQGQSVGQLLVSVSLQMQPQHALAPPSPAANALNMGLPELVGLKSLIEGCEGLDYYGDNMTQSASSPSSAHSEQEQQDRYRRQQQLGTMGYFVTHAYLEQHLQNYLLPDAQQFQDRARAYAAALAMFPKASDNNSMTPTTPCHLDRNPKPFRPSSSRPEVLLSGIPFNVHTASLSLDVLDPEQKQNNDATLGAVFYNVTCGAPADHARGFGNVFPTTKSSNNKDPPTTTTTTTTASPGSPQHIGLTSPVGPVSGGLRRLEAKREEIAEQVRQLQTSLIMSVANYFIERRNNSSSSRNLHAPNTTSTHVPALHNELQGLRWKVFEAIQSLHHITWICAVRRASVFSQAMGTAVTLFLASLADQTKWQSTWPDVWARHGYLVTYEGLLSAVGKELGMIEDASVGIDMLRMVSVILVPDDGVKNANRVPVPHTSYVKWIQLTPSKTSFGGTTEFKLEIGMVRSYFDRRIPNCLKSGVPVRFYPLLFEVGVDIRQWGAHAVKNNLSGDKQQNKDVSSNSGGLLLDDDEEDAGGMVDDDVLVQLNYEAFQKMNAYAHKIAPVYNADANSTTSNGQKIHPTLETLYQHIASSAGKMNHDILDEAAYLAQQLGGGGIVFCKSGKDRTAMHVTFKQAQFINTYRKRHPSPHVDPSEEPVLNNTNRDATLMRVHGTRLPICEKNVGQAKYAFNSLQVKFMPDALRPPIHTLAGFLKGGKVFSGGGGIES